MLLFTRLRKRICFKTIFLQCAVYRGKLFSAFTALELLLLHEWIRRDTRVIYHHVILAGFTSRFSRDCCNSSIVRPFVELSEINIPRRKRRGIKPSARINAYSQGTLLTNHTFLSALHSDAIHKFRRLIFTALKYRQ